MDLIQILRKRIDALDEGSYTLGLRAVLQHVQVASHHLVRGSEASDDTAFTDAIYRTNQAFEGSLKEAYRVLAAKDPDKVRPYDIEAFFQNHSVLRSRVIEQMSHYRTEWRNPSTHDYKLDFNEDEALLAIVTVCAFAIVLIDQIIEKINFEHAKATAQAQIPVSKQIQPLVDATADALAKFRFQSTNPDSSTPVREVELVGALAGYLGTVLPETKTATEVQLESDTRQQVDLIIERNSERVLLEVKRTRRAQNTSLSISQVTHYIAISGIRDAILYFYDDAEDVEMQRKDYPLPNLQARIIVIGPNLGKPSKVN